MSTPIPAPPAIVLDTNAVLDWLVFRNPEFASLDAALRGGGVRWIATAAMREELTHVLGRGHLDAWEPDPSAIGAMWERLCNLQPEPATAHQPPRLRCSDPDDQQFIDLARTAGARWLVSRDRAVLKLARRLREHGVLVIRPGDWRPLEPTT